MHLYCSSVTQRRKAFGEDLDELMMVQCQSSPFEGRIIRPIFLLAFCQPLGENLRPFGETNSEFCVGSCKGSELGAEVEGSRPLMSAS